MNNYEHYIGVDVSKKTLDISALKGKKKLFHLCVSNDKKGLKALGKELRKHKISPEKALLCLENSGSYGDLLAFWSVQNSYNVWIENPIAIKRSLGLVRGKNDKIDAYRIALYANRFSDKCRLWEPPRKVIRILKQLNTLRKRLIKTRKILKTPLKESDSLLPKSEQKELERCCANTIKSLEKDIKGVEKKIEQLIESDKKLSRMVEVIVSVRSVGIQIAVGVILLTNEFKDINEASKISCCVGIVPFEHKSGTSIQGRTRVSHLANKELKCLLHMGAISAINHSEELREYYEQKIQEGKPKMVAINSVRNKLIARICACVRDDRTYEEKYVRKKA